MSWAQSIRAVGGDGPFRNHAQISYPIPGRPQLANHRVAWLYRLTRQTTMPQARADAESRIIAEVDRNNDAALALLQRVVDINSGT